MCLLVDFRNITSHYLHLSFFKSKLTQYEKSQVVPIIRILPGPRQLPRDKSPSIVGKVSMCYWPLPTAQYNQDWVTPCTLEIIMTAAGIRRGG